MSRPWYFSGDLFSLPSVVPTLIFSTLFLPFPICTLTLSHIRHPPLYLLHISAHAATSAWKPPLIFHLENSYLSFQVPNNWHLCCENCLTSPQQRGCPLYFCRILLIPLINTGPHCIAVSDMSVSPICLWVLRKNRSFCFCVTSTFNIKTSFTFKWTFLQWSIHPFIPK